MAGVTRAQVVARAGTLAAALAGLPVAILGAAPPAAADAPIDDVCDTTTVGTTITLNGDCVTTEALTVPDGFTLNGGGNTISAENPHSPVLEAVIEAEVEEEEVEESESLEPGDMDSLFEEEDVLLSEDEEHRPKPAPQHQGAKDKRGKPALPSWDDVLLGVRSSGRG